MPEPDLTDLRDRVTDLRKELRATIPLITTIAQLGERMLSVQDDSRDLREDLRVLWTHVNALEQRPAVESKEQRGRRAALRQSIVGAIAGAVASGTVFGVLHLIGWA
jgi:hypothetical protein